MMQAGDIIGVKGHSWATAPVLWATQGEISHIGLVMATEPVCLAIESTWPRVRTVPLSVMIQSDAKVILMKSLNLTREQRETIIWEACKFSATRYSLLKAGLLGLDKLTDSYWFTDHLDFSDQSICCYLAVHSYRKAGKFFGQAPDAAISSQDVLTFARQHPQFYKVLPLRDEL